MVKAVLCDIDGTLVESNWLHAAAWKDAFAVADIVVDLEDARRQIGKGGDELIPVFVPWWKRKAIEEPLKAYRQFIFRQDYLHQVKPFPRVRELLTHMKENGISVSLASSAHKSELDIYKKIANIEDLVEESSSADDAERSKPHPDVFEATLKKLGLSPKEVLALGDTPYDAEAAGKASILTVGVTTGGWNEKELLQAGCIEVYKDVEDLLANFERSAFHKDSEAAALMSMTQQLIYLFVLAMPVASIAWTITHEEIIREFRENCHAKSAECRRLYQRKFFYLFTCEYCFSHYVALIFLIATRFQLLYPDWRGYLIALFSLVWIANVYMGLFGMIRLDLKKERVEIAKSEATPSSIPADILNPNR